MSKSTVAQIPLKDIRANEVALREVDRSSEDFLGLVESIKQMGVLSSISVRVAIDPETKQEYYEIIDGLHRFTASQEAGLDDIPAQIMDKTDAEVLVAQIIGNVQRIETKPVEYTQGLLRILGMNPLMTEAELAVKLGKSPAWIAQRLSLNKLDPKVAQLVDSGEIALANAYPLTRLPKEEQINWIERAMTMGTGEFGPQVLARAKEIRDANRKGNDAPKEEWSPQPYLRKLTEIKDGFESAESVDSLTAPLLSENDSDATVARITAAVKHGIAWTINMDPASQEASKLRQAERIKKEAEAKDKRDAERKALRAKEAEAKQAKAQKEAEDAAAKMKATNEAKLAALEEQATEAQAKRGELQTA